MDTRGPYLILSTPTAAKEYTAALRIAGELHAQAHFEQFLPGDLAAARSLLEKHRPYYVLLFIKPEELDTNFAWAWLAQVSRLDRDPFVDVRTGFVTGETPAAAAAFVRRLAAAVAGTLRLPAQFVDNLGPNEAVAKEAFFKNPGSFMAPVLAGKWPAYTISHGRRGFAAQRLNEMAGAGIVHFGGHGYPDRVVDCLNGPFSRKLKLSPSLLSSGACYTGVTGRWFDVTSGKKVAVRQVDSRYSFCLNILTNQVVAYMAALHADHGVPVYQELEYLAYSGASLGNAMKHTHDGVMLAAGGKTTVWEPLRPGQKVSGTPADFMLRGTASRVLFGDPALIVTDAVTDPPFAVSVRRLGSAELEVTAELRNPLLLTTYGDTYYSDMSQTKQFNERALLECTLPTGWEEVTRVNVKGAWAAGSPLPSRLVGFAVERDAGRNILWVQVDLPASGFMQSSFRAFNSRVVLRVFR